MGIYVDIIANETTARTTETQMLAGNTATAGKYYPKFKGKLVKVRIKVTPQAATSRPLTGRVGGGQVAASSSSPSQPAAAPPAAAQASSTASANGAVPRR